MENGPLLSVAAMATLQCSAAGGTCNGAFRTEIRPRSYEESDGLKCGRWINAAASARRKRAEGNGASLGLGQQCRSGRKQVSVHSVGLDISGLGIQAAEHAAVIARSVEKAPPKWLSGLPNDSLGLAEVTSPDLVDEGVAELLWKDTVLDDLVLKSAGKKGGPETLYADEATAAEVERVVAALIAANRTEELAERSVALGQGTWEVFYAPHIRRLSGPLGVKFDPIRYTLKGTKILSNVRYTAPLIGEGWLSASGDFMAEGDDKVKVLFSSFWWDTGVDLRSDPAGKGSGLTNVVNSIGQALFLPQFSVFPVLYLDSNFVVFQFTPLQSNIAAVRVG